MVLLLYFILTIPLLFSFALLHPLSLPLSHSLHTYSFPSLLLLLLLPSLCFSLAHMYAADPPHLKEIEQLKKDFDKAAGDIGKGIRDGPVDPKAVKEPLKIDPHFQIGKFICVCVS